MINLKQSLLKGMYVRVPLDVEDEAEGQYRDYRLGQVERWDELLNTVVVTLETHSPGQPALREQVECDASYVQRCRILPETQVVHAQTEQRGQVLLICNEQWVEGQLCDYYVEIEGQTERVGENHLLVPSHRQDPDPYEQLSDYELHSPVWKFKRDQLISSYAELHTATFGIEDLVGSRIMLLPHQAEVVSTVLSDEACRYILADEVGLGKTIEACVILKGLSRRYPGLKTLIVVPASLSQQWANELDRKFWLNFPLWSELGGPMQAANSSGLIVSTEELVEDDLLWFWLSLQKWGLLIVDEAHHIGKKPELYERVHELSHEAARVLILSATPIQRRAEEFLALLKLMNPMRYDSIHIEQFREILAAQETIRRTIVGLAVDLNEEDFEAELFEEDIEEVVEALQHDTVLAELVEQVAQKAESRDGGLRAAQEAVAYVSENYRIESRMIRNRRVNLQIDLPKRAVDTSYHYEPGELETEVLEILHDYVENFIEKTSSDTIAIEYGRILLHAAASSPHVLITLLEQRQSALSDGSLVAESDEAAPRLNVASPAAPRQEAERIRQLINRVPLITDEEYTLENLLWLSGGWQEETEKVLDKRSRQPSHRLVQVLQAIRQGLRDSSIRAEGKREAKIVVFSAWAETLQVLRRYLEKEYGLGATAEFHTQVNPEALQDAVDKFQSNEFCRILLCDELGGEGRNFQIADLIIHLDLPWTPAQIEQRIGRVDRLGRTGTVLSVVPFARARVEHDLFRLWHEALQLFSRSMSGLEIALEGILDEVQEALASDSRDGVRQLLPVMKERSDALREAVEEERYYEENAINRRRRDEFAQMSKKYRDGAQLGRTFTSWASLAGLKNRYKPDTDTVRFFPKRFNAKSMQNAKFVDPPNMQEAFIRSGRKHDLVITGTFNRDVAVQREDLAFFAPGERWTDRIVRNALEADRGRCCAIRRTSDEVSESWQGFELFYRLSVNPRPLYEAGFAPIHLLRAQGFLYVPTHRVLVSIEGDVVTGSQARRLSEIMASSYNRRDDLHLGKRGNGQILAFQESYPPDMWQAILEQAFAVGKQQLEEQFDFVSDLAEEAAEEFERTALGLRAATVWLHGQQHNDTSVDMSKVNDYENISAALIEGITHPLWQLESVCFWQIERR